MNQATQNPSQEVPVCISLPQGLLYPEAKERAKKLFDTMEAVIKKHNLQGRLWCGSDYGLGIPESQASMMVYTFLPKSEREAIQELEQVIRNLEPDLPIGGVEFVAIPLSDPLADGRAFMEARESQRTLEA